MALDPAELAARFRAIWTSTPAAGLSAPPDDASPQVSDPRPRRTAVVDRRKFPRNDPEGSGGRGPARPGVAHPSGGRPGVGGPGGALVRPPPPATPLVAARLAGRTPAGGR